MVEKTEEKEAVEEIEAEVESEAEEEVELEGYHQERLIGGGKKLNSEVPLSKKYYNRLMRKLRKQEILSYAIIAFLIISMFTNFLIVYNKNRKTTGEVKTNKVTKVNVITERLPVGINMTVVDNMIALIKIYYNEDNNEKLYNMLGEYARTVVTRSNFDKSLRAFKALGKIIDVSYENYQFNETKNGENWFTLVYNAKYEKGQGYATITIKVKGDAWEVTGFRFNITEKTEGN